jgi:hypothetical protein
LSFSRGWKRTFSRTSAAAKIPTEWKKSDVFATSASPAHDLSRPYESPDTRYADVDDTDFVSGSRVIGSGRPQPGRVPTPVRTPEGPAVKEARERLAEQLRSKEPALFKPGDRVRHLHFGDGIVTKSTGGGPDEQVTVVFPGHGEKKLMVSYAKLEKL